MAAHRKKESTQNYVDVWPSYWD